VSSPDPIEVWSPSRIRVRRSCPRQEFLRYRRGVHTRVAASGATDAPQVATKLRLGTISHAGLEAAYREAARLRHPLPSGSRMSRFSATAMTAIGEAWDRFGMPAPGEDGSEIMAAIEAEVFDVLARLPVPRPAYVLGVEHELTVPSPAGRMMRGVLDLALRTGPDSLHIRDWKRKSLRSLPKTTELPRDDALAFYRYAARYYWPWARRVSVGLYSTISNREIVADLPWLVALDVVAGHDVIADKADADREHKPTPDGSNCGDCPVRDDCPVWTRLKIDNPESA
jgi:hypothetical protein